MFSHKSWNTCLDTSLIYVSLDITENGMPNISRVVISFLQWYSDSSHIANHSVM